MRIGAGRSKLSLERQRVEVWAARVAQVGRGERATEFPDEVHLGVERGLRQPRLVQEQEAAVEESARADESEHDGNPRVALAPRGGDQPDGDARRDEDAERQVEGRHAPLQQARARRQAVELFEGGRAPLLVKLDVLAALHYLLEAVNERAHAVNDATEARRDRKSQRAAGRD